MFKFNITVNIFYKRVRIRRQLWPPTKEHEIKGNVKEGGPLIYWFQTKVQQMENNENGSDHT